LFYAPVTVIEASIYDNTINNESTPADNYWENIERNAKRRIVQQTTKCCAVITSRMGYFPVQWKVA
jgi:hypothetical protein